MHGTRLEITCFDACPGDRKSTRLNSSHLVISYAVFCLKKKKKMPARRPLRASLSTRERLVSAALHLPHAHLTYSDHPESLSTLIKPRGRVTQPLQRYM